MAESCAYLAEDYVVEGVGFLPRHVAELGPDLLAGLHAAGHRLLHLAGPLLGDARRLLQLGGGCGIVDPNLNAWIGGQSTYSAPLCSTNAEGFYSCTYVEHTLWQADGARFGGIVVALLILAALWAFRHRDVT